MSVYYKSTRGNTKTVTASKAILTGLSPDGGLYVPTEIPQIDKPLSVLAGMSYQELAYDIMSKFLTDFTECCSGLFVFSDIHCVRQGKTVVKQLLQRSAGHSVKRDPLPPALW